MGVKWGSKLRNNDSKLKIGLPFLGHPRGQNRVKRGSKGSKNARLLEKDHQEPKFCITSYLQTRKLMIALMLVRIIVFAHFLASQGSKEGQKGVKIARLLKNDQ